MDSEEETRSRWLSHGGHHIKQKAKKVTTHVGDGRRSGNSFYLMPGLECSRVHNVGGTCLISQHGLTG